MKKLLLALALFSVTAFPSGKIQLRPSYSMLSEKVGGQVGVAIWQPLFLGINYNMWTGAGLQPRVLQSHVFYVVSQHSLEVWSGNIGYGIGYKYSHADQESVELSNEHSVFAQLSFKIW